MALDDKYKVCGYLASLKRQETGNLWRQVINLNVVDKAVNADLQVTISNTNGQDVRVLPKMVNVTQGDDFSARYFYDGKC